MTLSRRSLFKYVGAGTAALTSVPVLAQEKSLRRIHTFPKFGMKIMTLLW